MSKTYRPYDPEQQLLLPAALQEWLPPDHMVYFISDVVEELDLSVIMARYEGEERGGPPYYPRMLVKVLLYGYCTGVASSRRIARRLHEDIAFRVPAANNTPDFRTISDFRRDHLEALSGLFVQVLELCRRAGLVKLGHVALDGTKVKVNASKHKAMSYGRMKEREAQLEAEVAEMLERAREADPCPHDAPQPCGTASASLARRPLTPLGGTLPSRQPQPRTRSPRSARLYPPRSTAAAPADTPPCQTGASRSPHRQADAPVLRSTLVTADGPQVRCRPETPNAQSGRPLPSRWSEAGTPCICCSCGAPPAGVSPLDRRPCPVWPLCEANDSARSPPGRRSPCTDPP